MDPLLPNPLQLIWKTHLPAYSISDRGIPMTYDQEEPKQENNPV